jgi:hypothetical protein
MPEAVEEDAAGREAAREATRALAESAHPAAAAVLPVRRLATRTVARC